MRRDRDEPPHRFEGQCPHQYCRHAPIGLDDRDADCDHWPAGAFQDVNAREIWLTRLHGASEKVVGGEIFADGLRMRHPSTYYAVSILHEDVIQLPKMTANVLQNLPGLVPVSAGDLLVQLGALGGLSHDRD